MSNENFFGQMLQTIGERGRRFLSFSLNARLRNGADAFDSIEAACRKLLSSQGEASGTILAKHILDLWEAFDAEQKRRFMRLLLEQFGPDGERLDKAIEAYRAEPTPAAMYELHAASEARRQELIRRLNLAPNAVLTLVRMRESLLEMKAQEPSLEAVDADFVHLFASWFNRGFLTLMPISWSTPADILEKIIQYEAVHEIDGWSELRRRLEPEDRRCFAFFHPQLVDEPLIFVEVALTAGISDTIADLLDDSHPVLPPQETTSAVFYSISNCQAGLRGISLGNFLIKQVVEDLRRELPQLNTFVTLSPVPNFASWLSRQLDEQKECSLIGPDERQQLATLLQPNWAGNEETCSRLKPLLETAAARYFLQARTENGRIVDSVARFHLGNGARLERINFLADRSPRAMRQAHGLMVNYLYRLDQIEANHEAYASRNEVAASSAVRRLAYGRSGAPHKSGAARGQKEKEKAHGEKPVHSAQRHMIAQQESESPKQDHLHEEQ